MFADRDCIRLDEQTTLFPPDKLPKFAPNTPGCDNCLRFNFAFVGPRGERNAANNGWHYKGPDGDQPYQTNCDKYDEDLLDRSDADTCSKCSSNSNSDCNKCIYGEKIVRDQTLANGNDVKTVIMVFSALRNDIDDNIPHPIHLHGHAFHVLYIGYGQYDMNNNLISNSADLTCGNDDRCMNPTWADGVYPSNLMTRASGENGLINRNRIRKDTVVVPKGGYVVIAFRASIATLSLTWNKAWLHSSKNTLPQSSG